MNTAHNNTTSSLNELSEVIDTYEGMLSMCPNGEGSDWICDCLDKAYAAYNSALIEMGE